MYELWTPGDLDGFDFGSHEHEMLKVSYWDQSLSVVRRQQFPLKHNSSCNTGPVLTKLHKHVPSLCPSYITRPVLTQLHRNVPKCSSTKNSWNRFDPSETWPSRGVVYCVDKKRYSPLKPVVRIQNNLTEMVTRCSYTKVAIRNLIHHKSMAARGRGLSR